MSRERNVDCTTDIIASLLLTHTRRQYDIRWMPWKIESTESATTRICVRYLARAISDGNTLARSCAQNSICLFKPQQQHVTQQQRFGRRKLCSNQHIDKRWHYDERADALALKTSFIICARCVYSLTWMRRSLRPPFFQRHRFTGIIEPGWSLHSEPVLGILRAGWWCTGYCRARGI